MAVSDFRDLRCWQLADELRREVHAICARPAVARDRRFCTSFTDAAGSVCRNLAEGFARYESAEIVQFFRYALASRAEVQDHLDESRLREFVDAAEHQRLSDLSAHTKAATLKFMKFHKERVQARRRKTAPGHRTT